MEQVFINGKLMSPGMSFGREITIKEAEDKKKLKSWLEEDEWDIKNGK